MSASCGLKPGDHLQDLGDLLLVDDDAVGVGQNLGQQRVEERHRRRVVFALHVPWDLVHRSGAVEGDECRNFLEAVGAKLAAQAGHAPGLHLEHPGGVAVLEQLVGLRVAEVQLVRVHLDAAVVLHVQDRVADDSQVPKAQEVHLQQADLLDGPHLVLGDYVAVGPLHRADVGQGLPADHHAGGVHRVLARAAPRACGRSR